MKKLFYFGCIRDKGHYFFLDHKCSTFDIGTAAVKAGLPGLPSEWWYKMDGAYTPKGTMEAGRYKITVIPMLPTDMLVVSWHDYSVDSRPGSHSTFFSIDYDSATPQVSAEAMLDEAVKRYPAVMGRQRRPTFLELEDRNALQTKTP